MLILVTRRPQFRQCLILLLVWKKCSIMKIVSMSNFTLYLVPKYLIYKYFIPHGLQYIPDSWPMEKQLSMTPATWYILLLMTINSFDHLPRNLNNFYGNARKKGLFSKLALEGYHHWRGTLSIQVGIPLQFLTFN